MGIKQHLEKMNFLDYTYKFVLFPKEMLSHYILEFSN